MIIEETIKLKDIMKYKCFYPGPLKAGIFYILPTIRIDNNIRVLESETMHTLEIGVRWLTWHLTLRLANY